MKNKVNLIFCVIMLISTNVCAQPETKQQKLTIKNNDRSIYGILSETKCAEKKKIAIISHGFNGTYRFGCDYFETLNKLGYTVYAFDYPCGSVSSKSDNNTMNMSIIDEKKDLMAIVDYFNKLPDTNKDHIVLIGESQGGLVSALAAAELKEKINKIILIYPALCIPDNWNNYYQNVKDIPDTTRVWNIPLGKKFFEELHQIKVYQTIQKYEGDVLIIHGSKDPVVPLFYSERAMKIYKNAHIGVIPGAKHGFSSEERETAIKFVNEFLEIRK